MQRCAENGGSNCILLFTYHNQCVAVAQPVKGGRMYAVGAPPSDNVEQLALNNCGGEKICRVIYSRCSEPERIQ